MHEGRPIAHHSETLSGVVLKYQVYDKELYVMHQVAKHWRSYIVGKETVIHINHKPLQFLQTQTKLQQARHAKWMLYLQQFNLVVKYKKGVTNKIADLWSRTPTSISLSVVMQLKPFPFKKLHIQYEGDKDFHSVAEELHQGERKPDFHLQEGLLYKDDKLCIPQGECRVALMREAHTSKVAGHFGVGKTLLNLQRYVYWPRMQVDVAKFIKGHVLCNTSKPANRKLGLYIPLLVASRPWESISMDFLRGLPKTQQGHDYLLVVVDRFSKMTVLIPCKKTITGQETTKLFF
eukprot:Gb_36846 [translate_table: standard]